MIGDYVVIGKESKIWHPEQVNIYGRKDNPCIIGDNVNIGSFVEIGPGVVIGDNVSIGAHCFIPEGVTIEDDCFIGPRTTFTNDKYPMSRKECWLPICVKKGAKIGAGSVILPGVTIGEKALIGAGSVVTKNVNAGVIVKGNPATEMEHKVVYCIEACSPQLTQILSKLEKWDSIGLPNTNIDMEGSIY